MSTRVCKQPITVLYFEFENEVKFYNSKAWPMLKYVTYSFIFKSRLNRGSYMHALVLLNTLNELRKRDKTQSLLSISSLFIFLATSLINAIIRQHEF